MKKTLTKRQNDVFKFIKKWIKENGYPPTVREIGTGVKLTSTSNIQKHLKALQKKGYIKRSVSKHRAFEIIDDKKIRNSTNKNEIKYVNVPIIKKIVVGQPIMAFENIENTFPVMNTFIDDKEHFMLQVQDESMINAGILNGDYVLIKQQNVANNGEIVVVLIEDEPTIRRFYKENNQIRLQSDNSSMNSIIIDSVEILGLVKGVFRKI